MVSTKEKLLKKRKSTNMGDVFHALQNVFFPIAVAGLVYYSLAPIALLLVLLSKWRVFAVQPRHWFANIRTNSPDLIVGLGFLTFMGQSTTNFGLFLSTISYIVWLLFLKPGSSSLLIGIQALATQIIGLEALFWFADDISETLLIVASWTISLMAARHFLSAFEEPLAPLISQIWALFVAQLAWFLNRWLIVYTVYRNIVVPQVVLVVGTVGFVIGSLYYLYKQDNLRKNFTRRYVLYGCVILVLIIAFSDWTAEL
jgi:hypothetical protein